MMIKDYWFIILIVLSILFLIWYRIFYNEKSSYTKFEDKWKLLPIFPKPMKKNSESNGEFQCRQILERFFNRPFKKNRPNFLKNDKTGKNLEIDCFNAELGLGIEYNGSQHYYFTPYYHKTQADFENQKYRDELKRQKCKDNGIILIEIPYSIVGDDIEKYLIKELQKNGFYL